MKKNIILGSALALLALGTVTSCDDFEEVNTSPTAVTADKVKPYYSLAKSIRGAQQDPNIAERLFVLNWAASARQDGESGNSIACGGSSDDWTSQTFSYMGQWLTSAYTCIKLVDENLEMGTVTEHEAAFYKNLRAFARIWRVELMYELTDSYGPAPLNGFEGENPDFSNEEEVYKWMFTELTEAVNAIDTSVEPSADEAKSDPSYGFNAAKWKKYGISMHMRLAMRLSEVQPSTAQSEFEAAVKQGAGITATDETFAVQEYPGWDDWTGVMSRMWDFQTMSATMANLTTNFGGAKSVDALVGLSSTTAAEYQAHVKDASTYAGIKLDRHFCANTDNPTKQLFFDGLPERVDPRALVYFTLPGDLWKRNDMGADFDSYVLNSEKNGPAAKAPQTEKCYTGDVTDITVDCTFAWNGLNCGYGWDDDATTNGLVNGSDLGGYGYAGTYPNLSDSYRKSGNKRVFFGPWETYFLLAEAALRGWNVGTTAETAYYNGIKASFDYNGLSALYSDYINSEDYNRVGTSVKWSHTTEPTATQMTYKDYAGAEHSFTYQYPDASKIMYSGHKLNDQLTKIITQLYIANTPWLPLENWSTHRRLGLPFWEMPTGTSTITYLASVNWTTSSWQKGQDYHFYSQRMKYPSSLASSDEEGYNAAVSLLKDGDITLSPLWWAKGGTGGNK